MRKSNDKPIKEAIEQMFNAYKLKRRFNETAIKAHWPDIIGASVANRTSEIYVHQGKLFLRIESSVIKNEIQLIHQQVIDKINEMTGIPLVNEIIFL